jgi:glycerol-3-phosphate acyltransferase PlsY
MPASLAFVVAAYLVGSVSFAVVVSRLYGLPDPHSYGSGNPGATNVLRTGNKGLAALTLLLDGGKGAAAVLIGARFGIDMAVIAGAAALIGHIFPVWLRFKGGKGVATALGVLLAVAFPAGALACATWVAVAALTRYSSLAALTALAAAPAYAWWLVDFQRMELAAFIAIVVWLRHAANIRRLLKGEEPRIGK